MKKNQKYNQHGITLIALVITIIILLILAGVAIWGGIGSQGVLSRASEAVTKYTTAAEEESKMDIQLTPEIEALLPDGTKMTFTLKTLKDYIGKSIKNFNTTTALPTGTEFIINTSATYKLYFIDTENKYGDGAGTIYLKADQLETAANQQKKIADLLNQGNFERSLIKKFNPSLYKEGVTSPNPNNTGMKKAVCLLDPEIWNGLIEDTNPLKDSINYVIGAPSLELLIDSYNSFYNLTDENQAFGSARNAESPRVKLFYQYPRGNNTNGYYVAPKKNAAENNKFGEYTDDYTLMPYDVTKYNEANLFDLFYPTNKNTSYYIASPSAKSNSNCMRVLGNNGGFISYDGQTASFCPIVSLKTGAELEYDE